MTARVIFLGSPEFAVPSLRSLHADLRIEVPLVVTQPDRPAGRGRKLRPPAIKSAAEELGIPTYQPETLRTAEARDRMAREQPDVLLVVAYGEILRKSILELAPHGVLNVHPSLLPRHRGAAPVPAAILAGDNETGISIIKLIRRLDAGPILAQSSIPLNGTETSGELSDRLAELAANILPDIVVDWVEGRITAEPQDESRATYGGEWNREDARINWHASAREIDRLIRAANPWPMAWTALDGEPFRIIAATPTDIEVEGVPGTVNRRSKEVVVRTGDGGLVLQTVQPAGRKAMDALSWWNGVAQVSVTFTD